MVLIDKHHIKHEYCIEILSHQSFLRSIHHQSIHHQRFSSQLRFYGPYLEHYDSL